MRAPKTNFRKTQAVNLLKADWRIGGQTRNSRPIYINVDHPGELETLAGYTAQDHMDAYEWHMRYGGKDHKEHAADHKAKAEALRGNSTIKEKAKEIATSLQSLKAKFESIKKNDPIQAVFDIHGIQVNVEWPKGSRRHYTGGYDKEMQYDYGYINNTTSRDGMELDAYIGPHTDSRRVFLVEQMKSGKYNQDKAMLGFRTPEEAAMAYKAHCDSGYTMGTVKEISMEELKSKIKDRPGSLPKGEKKEHGEQFIVKSEHGKRHAIAVDFDNTIAEDKCPEVGALKPGTVEALQKMKEAGYKIIIYSARNNAHHKDREHAMANMKKFLDANSVPYNEIDDGSKGKPMVDWYIDDKAIPFSGDWSEVLKKILT